MKKKIKYLILLNFSLLFLIKIPCLAERIDISVYYNENIKSVMILTESGPFGVTLDNSVNFIVKSDEILHLTLKDKSIEVKTNDGFNRICREIRMTGIDDNAAFKIKPLIPDVEEREYKGDMIARFDVNRILLINNVIVDQYLEGVVLSEGGMSGLPSYYKTQAILCRTYLYKHKNKHIEEGFNLCDDVHCQAYHGSGSEFPQISNAVKMTAGLVVVDKNSELITAAYHSNCGGQTINSSDVWVGDYPYLRSVNDHFCRRGNNSKWIKIIAVEDWWAYIKENGYKDNDINPNAFEFKQNDRKKYYSINKFRLSLKKIREDWKLKSSFFDVFIENDEVVLEGKGYGHGVGLCQEGAMEMAQQGKDFRKIINFYYKNVKVVQISK